jgi:hypothetical protein
MTLSELTPLLQKEMDYGYGRFGKYHNSHEHYAVLQEEVDRLKLENARLRRELGNLDGLARMKDLLGGFK